MERMGERYNREVGAVMRLIRKIVYLLATRKPRPGEYVDPQPDRVLR